MKSLSVFLFILLLPFLALGQFGEQQLITTVIEDPSRSIPCDMDGDGDYDILIAGNGSCELCWLENLDGNGNFSDPIILDNNPVSFIDIKHIDLDGDGDKDIVYIRNNPSTLEWLENIDGNGNYGPANLFLEQDFITQFIFNDLDQDGDLDLILSFTDTINDWISWFENIDGNGNFGSEQNLINNINFLSNIIIEDIDNDGHADLLTSNENNGPAQLLYYKNLGNQTFDSGNTVFQFQYAQSDFTSINNIKYVDVTADGIKDIVFNTINDDVDNFLNLIPGVDNNSFFGEHSILYATHVANLLVDVDNDNDIDMITYHHNSDVILFYEYDETGQGFDFSNGQVITSEFDFIRDVDAADFNDDGLLDLVSVSSGDNKVAWYTNEALSLGDFNSIDIRATPNPVRSILTIGSNASLLSATVVNVLGQQLHLEFDNNQLDFSSVSNGLYFVTLTNKTSKEQQTLKILKK